MTPKVTIDWANKQFIITSGETSINVQDDIYEYWKEQVQIDDNSKWEQAMTSVGGEPLPGGKYVPSFFFLLNGWKVHSYEGITTVFIGTNLFTDDGSSPFVQEAGHAPVIAETTTGVTTTGGSGVLPADILAIVQGVWAEVQANGKTAETNLIEARDEAELGKALSA